MTCGKDAPRSVPVGACPVDVCARSSRRVLFASEAHPGSKPEPLSRHTTVDVIEPDDVLLIELAEGDLQYPHLAFASRGEPVNRSSGDEYLLPVSGSRTSSPSCTWAPLSSMTQSSSRRWWYWRESVPPGATVMILTVLGRLCVYCSNLPQGLSTFIEGGR